jgi:hypothetical protein
MSKNIRTIMAKGKKTVIKEIKLLENDEILINGKEYVILESTTDIQTATTMKISSNGNRILRFEDEKKKARIDVKRSIDIIKCTFRNPERARMYAKKPDKHLIANDDKKEILETVNSFVKARAIVADFQDKNSKNYDSKVGISTFYLLED